MNTFARRTDFDFLRVIAMLAVVGIHCVMPLIPALLPDNDSWLVADTIDNFLRWCVPIFVMVSGALLLRPASFEHRKTFYQRRMSRILLPLLAWPLLYWAWAFLVRGQTIAWQDVGLNFLAGTPLIGAQLYFLFIIAGLYVLTPLLSLYAASVPQRTFRLTAIAALALASCWLIVEVKLLGRPESYNLFTWCLPYIGYYMLGYSLKDVWLSRKQLCMAAIGFIVFGAFNALISVYTRLEGNMFFQAYLSPTVIGLTMCVYLGGRALYARLQTGWLDRSLQRLAQLSFGVYLVHVMVLESIIYWFSLDNTRLDTAGILFVTVLPLSLLIVALLMRLPGLKHLVS